MLFDGKEILSNKEEVWLIRQRIGINSKETLFIQTGVLFNRKGVFSIRKEGLFIRQGMLANSKAPLFGAQAVRPSRFSCAASFFCLTKPWQRVYCLP
jgi:hypothetical protein